MRPFELLCAECHARDVGAKFSGGFLCQCAPPAANFQHAVTRVDVGHAQGAAHFGVLGLLHGLVQVTFEPGRRVVHGVVQPQLVKRIAQVVMRVDVFLAVGFGVAVEQVLDAVQQAPRPRAVHNIFHLLAVGHQHAQQLGEVGAGPVACDVALCKTDVA